MRRLLARVFPKSWCRKLLGDYRCCVLAGCDEGACFCGEDCEYYQR